jgi:uncharacterized repeat protein (TIGR03803 family)
MYISDFGRHALGIYAAAVLLAGCGGSQPPVGAPGAMPQTSGTATRTLLRAIPPARPFKVLHRFYGDSDGARPYAGLVKLRFTLYGTTSNGGPGCAPSGGCGTVYSIGTNDTKFTVLHDFAGRYSDGESPRASLLDVSDTLYGTTEFGGQYGYGTVYSISTSGKEKVIYSFTGSKDGAFPVAGLIDVNGMLYGTTSQGGASTGCAGGFGCGTVYRISTTGSEHVLYRFGGGSDGGNPLAGLIDVKGTLYGATEYGGRSKCYEHCGTVYSIIPSGTERVLYRFKGGFDGASPRAGLIDVNGTLYGTTGTGGGSGCIFSNSTGCGTVYSVSTVGVEKVIYSFAGGSDGVNPSAALIRLNGTLYGTTPAGGGSKCQSRGCGTIYSISTSGAEKVLHSFTGRSYGEHPVAGLVDVNGVLYGTTSEGGNRSGCSGAPDYGCGIVFALTPETK